MRKELRVQCGTHVPGCRPLRDAAQASASVTSKSDQKRGRPVSTNSADAARIVECSLVVIEARKRRCSISSDYVDQPPSPLSEPELDDGVCIDERDGVYNTGLPMDGVEDQQTFDGARLQPKIMKISRGLSENPGAVYERERRTRVRDPVNTEVCHFNYRVNVNEPTARRQQIVLETHYNAIHGRVMYELPGYKQRHGCLLGFVDDDHWDEHQFSQ